MRTIQYEQDEGGKRFLDSVSSTKRVIIYSYWFSVNIVIWTSMRAAYASNLVCNRSVGLK